MTTLKFIAPFLLITLYACGQQPAMHKVDSAAVQFNNQAMALVPFIDNADSSKKAISLLDKATEIDSGYFLGYSNKLMFYYQLEQFEKALLTNNKLIQLRPNAYDLYLKSGMLYSQLGDTTNAKTYFTKGLTICNSVLDTMKKTNRDFVAVTTNQAIAVLMLGDRPKANQILKVLYNNPPDDPDFDNVEKKYIQSLMNKDQNEIIELLSKPDKYSR